MKVQVNSCTLPPGSPQGNAPAGICIVLRPSTTGEVSKWKIISVPLKTVTEFAGVPFTMKTLPSKPPPGALRLTVKSVGGVPATMLPHGGELLVTEQPAGDGVGVGGTVAVGVGEAVGVAVAVLSPSLLGREGESRRFPSSSAA